MASPSITSFIGPEGGRITPLRVSNDPGLNLEADIRSLDEKDLLAQLSVAEQINATRNLSNEEQRAYFNLKNEMESRQQRKAGTEQDEIMKIFGITPGSAAGGGAVGGASGGGFNLAELISEALASGDKQRGAIDDIYESEVESGSRDLNDALAPSRSRLVSEQAALGRLGSPISSHNLNRFEEGRQKGLSQIISDASRNRSNARVGVESDILNRVGGARGQAAQLGLGGQELASRERLGLADLINNARQFGSTLGLEKEKLTENRRRTSLADLRESKALDLAEEAGKRQADAEDDGIFGKITGIVGGLGGLAGGIGGLAGGIGSIKQGNALGKLAKR